MLRIIGGDLKGRKLKTVDNVDTRPMTDRVRESLFSILAPELPERRFLDLFAGSGAVGFEALSRGASSAMFVENDEQCFHVVCENLAVLGLQARGIVFKMDAYKAVKMLADSGRRFDIVFAGPPYEKDHHNRILTSVIENGLCESDGLIVLQYRKGDTLRAPDGYSVDTREYGITSLSFLRRLVS